MNSFDFCVVSVIFNPIAPTNTSTFYQFRGRRSYISSLRRPCFILGPVSGLRPKDLANRPNSLNENFYLSFLGRSFISLGIIDLPKAQKIVGPHFLFWAPFPDYVPKTLLIVQIL